MTRNQWIIANAAIAGLMSASNLYAEAWSFGVMSDTQWKSNLDGQNPNTCAVGIINQVNTQFINKGVKLVLQVGDLVDSAGTDAVNLEARANAAQALYDNGIGFYPLRGNHESNQAASLKFQTLWHQTTGNNDTGHVYGATNFSSPSTNLNGLSYSFDYNNARFVMLDQFTPTDGKSVTGGAYSSSTTISEQQSWINNSLAGKPTNGHAFVLSHKQLFGGNHTDTLFGKADQNPDAQNAFIGSMDTNKVGYLFSGHDHMHNRSVVTSPDGNSTVRQLINSSDSYKFYTPSDLTGHGTDAPGTGYPNAGQLSKNRETQIAQELYSVGYYVVTIDGPRANVDFYSADPTPEVPGLADVDLTTTPSLTFAKRETFGYSLNGKEFLVAQGQSYNTVQDAISAGNGFQGTNAKILSGSNGSTGVDGNGRALTKQVNTGWTSIAEAANSDLKSDVLSVWGMTDLGATSTDTFALSISFTGLEGVSASDLANGYFGVRTKIASGEWALAGTNYKGDVAWNASYALGDYGYDSATGTAWAVINHNSDFAVAIPEPSVIGLLAMSSFGLIRRRRA